MAKNEDKVEKGSEKKNNPQENPSSEGIIPEEFLEAFPQEERGKVASIVKETMISGVMRRSNPIADKITTEHITQLISKSDDHDKRDREERKSERNYNLWLVLIGLAFIAFLIIFLRENEDLLIKVVIGIISFIGGFGFGLSRKKKTK